MEERCSRCEDYEDLKEELEKIKEDSEKETKSSLEKCECEKKKLKKQLVTVGIAVIIGGTLLGKEFVDKVAGFFDSFNTIKGSGAELISEAKPSSGWSPSSEPIDYAKLTPQYTGYSPGLISNVSLYNADLFYENSLDYSKLTEMATSHTVDYSVFPSDFKDIVNQNIIELTDPLYYYNTSKELSINPFEFKDPLAFEPHMSPPIPGPGALLSLAAGVLFLRKKRQR